MKSELNLATRPLLNTMPLFAILGALALSALALSVWNAALFWSTRSEARAVETQLAEIGQQERALLERREAYTKQLASVDLKQLSARVNAANVVLAEKSVSWALLLERLQELVPWHVRLDSIRTSVGPDKIGLALDLRTDKPDYYWDLIEKLEAHDCFSDVYPAQELLLPDGEYEVTLQLNHDPWCGVVEPSAARLQVRGRRATKGGGRG